MKACASPCDHRILITPVCVCVCVCLQPPRPSALSGTDDVDTFTFRYPSVEVHTTSVSSRNEEGVCHVNWVLLLLLLLLLLSQYQYSLIMDIINNLLLHKESKKKASFRGLYTLYIICIVSVRR